MEIPLNLLILTMQEVTLPKEQHVKLCWRDAVKPLLKQTSYFKSLVHLIIKRHTLFLQDETHSEDITAVGAALIYIN